MNQPRIDGKTFTEAWELCDSILAAAKVMPPESYRDPTVGKLVEKACLLLGRLEAYRDFDLVFPSPESAPVGNNTEPEESAKNGTREE